MHNGVCMLMPMAGRGSRFLRNGISLPKPLIQISDMPFFYWSSLGIIRECPNVQMVYVVLREHVENFDIDKKIQFFYPKSEIVVLEDVTSGAFETALSAAPYIDPNSILIINDCDHAFSYTRLNAACKSIYEGSDGFLSHFISNDPNYSYATYAENGALIRTAEKEVISDCAIAGVYGFKNISTLLRISESYIKNCKYHELFISGVYNEMVNSGSTIQGFNLDYHISFGTPEELKAAETRIPDLHKLQC